MGLGRTQRIKSSFGLFGLMFVLMWGWGYVSILRSDSYAYAQRNIKSDSEAIEQFGEIKSLRPAFINFKESYWNSIWTSQFEVVIKGEKKTGVVFFKMSNDGNGWVVEQKKYIINH